LSLAFLRLRWMPAFEAYAAVLLAISPRFFCFEHMSGDILPQPRTRHSVSLNLPMQLNRLSIDSLFFLFAFCYFCALMSLKSPPQRLVRYKNYVSLLRLFLIPPSKRRRTCVLRSLLAHPYGGHRTHPHTILIRFRISLRCTPRPFRKGGHPSTQNRSASRRCYSHRLHFPVPPVLMFLLLPCLISDPPASDDINSILFRNHISLFSPLSILNCFLLGT